MANFENVQNIGKIEMSDSIRCRSPLDYTWYSIEIIVSIDRPCYIPDYCDVTDYIRMLNGEELYMEDVVKQVKQYILGEVKAVDDKDVVVSASTKDASHLAVTVTSE